MSPTFTDAIYVPPKQTALRISTFMTIECIGRLCRINKGAQHQSWGNLDSGLSAITLCSSAPSRIKDGCAETTVVQKAGLRN